MSKIFYYELKRLLFNKFFFCLFFINGFFAWYTLTTDTIAGIAHTAPFSPWSFSAYLATIMPIVILTVLFLLSFYYSKKEKQVKTLTCATPVNTIHYALVRMAVIALGFLLLSVLIIGMSVFFYAFFFEFYKYTVFIMPCLITILPCFVLILGLGMILGRVNTGLLYALMLVSLAMNFIQLPGAFDFFGKRFYSSTPMSMLLAADGEPAFVLSGTFLAARAFYFVIGTIILIVGVQKEIINK
ncbi:MAG: hypothetical protein LBH42_07295 [Treponema sp.]|nr:hypothetical protein [Treponema sp.]